MTVEHMQTPEMFKSNFDIAIERATNDVWLLITEQIDVWWSAEFRALGDGSVVTLAAVAGGSILEKGQSGDTLEWYRVQMCVPGSSLYLVGYQAADWGGPKTSMLKLSLQTNEDGCVLHVMETIWGNVTEGGADSTEANWQKLFNGLKVLAES